MNLTQFLADLIRRLFAKTPKFFKIIQVLGTILAFLAKLPDFLNQVGVHVPVTEDPYKTIMIALGLAAAVVSQLAVADDSQLKSSINSKSK